MFLVSGLEWRGNNRLRFAENRNGHHVSIKLVSLSIEIFSSKGERQYDYGAC